MHGIQLMWGQHPWMQAPAVQKLFTVLGAPDVDIRFVGGCVRNAVLGLEVGEIDIASPELPEKVLQRLSAANIKAVPAGLDHGTVTAIVDGTPFEITTLRRDTACDGRYADVEFTTDWHEDSRRRDFTMNAMSLRPDGTLFDDHDGLEDAKAGRLRFVGDPADRIKEDYLRVLRLFRLFAWYGRGALDSKTLEACRMGAPHLHVLSAERVQQEISKLLSAQNPGPATIAMYDCDVFGTVLPEARKPSALMALLNLEGEAPEFSPDWLRRLAVLIPSEQVVSLAARLKFSNANRNRLRALTDREPVLDGDSRDGALRRALYECGSALVVDRVLISWANDEMGSENKAAMSRAIIQDAALWTPRSFPVAGEDVLALGVPAGPAVGQCLKELESRWIDGNFELSKEDLLSAFQNAPSSK